MIFDNLLITALVAEMTPKIRGGVLQKIKQISKEEVLIDIHCLGNTHTVFFSLNPKFPRFYLSNMNNKALLKAPDFCMILRKYLIGAYLKDIEKIGFDRIVKFTFEILEGDIFYLYCEIMGKHSNLILTDQNRKILASVKSIGASVSSVRQILIGKTYVLPPNMEKINPLECSFTLYESVIKNIKSTDKEGQIKEFINSFAGISPFLANELFYDIDVKDIKAGYNSLQNLKEICQQNKFTANLITDKYGKSNNVYPIFLKSVPAEHQLEKTDLNILCDMTSKAIISEEIFQNTKKNLLSQINNSLTYRKKVVKDCKDKIERGNSEKNLQIGELLKSSIHLFKKGDKKVKLIDYYDPEMKEIEVNLDEKLTPGENVEKYFRKYKKQKDAKEFAQERLVVVNKEIENLEIFKEKAQKEEKTVNLRTLNEELKSMGLLRTERTKKEENKNQYEGYKIYTRTSPEGWEILYGDNAKSNDYLTAKLAKPNDIWLHARQITSAHVIIRTTVKTCNNVPNNTILYAAKLAALNSDAKHSTMVPVDWTFKRFVRKPRGAAEGFVLYTHEKTIDVKL